MMAFRCGRIPAMLIALVLGATAAGSAQEFYLRPVIVQRGDTLSPEDFLLPGSGAVQRDGEIAAPSSHPALLPSAELRELLFPHFKDSAPVLVGRRSGFIPRQWAQSVWLPELLVSLDQIVPAESGRIELLLSDSLRELFGSAKNLRFSREAGSLREGRVRFRWEDAAGHSGRFLVSLREFLPSATATRVLSSGAELAPGDLRIARIEHHPGAEFPFVPEPGARYRLVRNLRPGAAVSASAVREIPDIRTGEAVSLLFRRGSISIEMTGRALASGRIGQTLPVVASSTGRKFHGVLTAGKEVEIGIE